MKGFSLIELMIVVAIVAILAVVAVPSYQGQIRETRRADAAAGLLQARQAMERHYSKSYSYATAAAGTTFPDKSPLDGAARHYTLSLSAQGANTYTITAAAQGSQTADSCGDLSMTQAGVKGASGAANAAAVEDCWR